MGGLIDANSFVQCACMQSKLWYGAVWYGSVWYGVVGYGMVWYGMVWYAKPGLLCARDLRRCVQAPARQSGIVLMDIWSFAYLLSS